jgi:3-oxoacyl-[acyl-carrier protein] reductase
MRAAKGPGLPWAWGQPGSAARVQDHPVDLGLAGRVYVVSGGSRGLGRATAEVLVAEGAQVVLGARDEAAVERAAQELGGPAHAVGVTADLGQAAAAQRLVEAAHTAYGGLDGALVSVGGPTPGTALDTAEEAWRSAFESVFLGALRLTRQVAGAVAADGGSIAMVLSSSVRAPIPGLAISNGLRPGLAGLVATLANELGPRGIRVNGLLPGRIATDRTIEIDRATGDPDGSARRAQANIPLGRYGQPEEFGRVAAFVLSPAASYLTGSMVTVDGGMIPTW